VAVSGQGYALLKEKEHTTCVDNDNDVERSKTMFKRMLVPLDGSAGAERAIPVAARIARASGGTIVSVRVVPSTNEVGMYASAANESTTIPPSAFEKDLAGAASYLADTIAAYAGDLTGIATEMDLGAGGASPTIFSTARFEHVDLIVMCSHGETGLKRWVFGSVAQQAVRRSPVLVLVLNEHGMTFPAQDAAYPLRVLVALDGSALSETALEPAAQLIAALAAPAWGALHLLRVVDLPALYGMMRSQEHIGETIQEEARREAETYVKAVADRLRAGPLAGTKHTITSSVAVSTDVAGTIIKLAEQAEGHENLSSYDLIVIATHGRSGLRRLVMGSVTEHVLDATKLPLLIVHSCPPNRDQSLGGTAPHETETEPEGTNEIMKAETEVQTWVGLL